jgi:hypothetical protein
MLPRELSSLKRIHLTDALSRFADGERKAFDEVYAEAWPAVRGNVFFWQSCPLLFWSELPHR